MVKSMFSIVVGYIISALLVLITFWGLATLLPDVFGQSAAIRPNGFWLALTYLFSVFYAAAGGFTTVTLSGGSWVKHALALSIVMIVVGVASEEFIFAAIGALGVFFGGKIGALRNEYKLQS